MKRTLCLTRADCGRARHGTDMDLYKMGTKWRNFGKFFILRNRRTRNTTTLQSHRKPQSKKDALHGSDEFLDGITIPSWHGRWMLEDDQLMWLELFWTVLVDAAKNKQIYKGWWHENGNPSPVVHTLLRTSCRLCLHRSSLCPSTFDL